MSRTKAFPVRVSLADFKAGKPRDSERCAVARALRRADPLKRKWYVDEKACAFDSASRLMIILPIDVANIVGQFDASIVVPRNVDFTAEPFVARGRK